VEQWEQVLGNNSPGDLCKVMMTSRYMNSLASRPDLWEDMKLNMSKVKKIGLKELFSIKRFEKIKIMDFHAMEFTSEELRRLWNEIPGTPLKNIKFGLVNLCEVPSKLLAMAVAELEEVELWNTKLTSQQCKAIFRFPAVDYKLKKLDIAGNDLSSVDPKCLARSVAELEEVNLAGTHLTSHQCLEIVRFSANDSKLKKLNIGFNNLSLVDPESLARSVAELEEVNLSVTHLTSEQFHAMFRFSAVDCKLKILNIAGNDMSTLEPDSMARSVAKLEEVNIKLTKLTNQQFEAIFRHAALDCKLKMLEMDMSDDNLSLVDPKSLTRTVTKFKEMDLSCTVLTSGQCEAIFRFDTVICKLKILNMSGHDLSSVDPESVARSIAELENVNLCDTKLTSQQCQAIFKVAAVDCKLKILNIGRNDLSSVDPKSLARFVAELEEVNLSNAKMTSQQCEAISRFPVNDSKIKKLSIDGNDLSTMDPEFVDRVQVDSKFIKIRLVAMDCSEIHFRVKKSIQMGKIKKEYEERTGIPIISLRFIFEGSRINDDDTPRNLGMEKNEAIEVINTIH